jgi:osmoprotectant transport system permease protein
MTALIAQSGPVIPNFGGGGSNSCVRENRTFCWDWFTSHWSSNFQPHLVEHIVLTAIAVSVGFVIAMAAALLAYRRHWFEQPFTIVTGILYTIPSLALFQILVPITGLTLLTAEIALVSYTLLIIFRNILTGLRDVPEDVREAARGMGFTRNQILWSVELPIAVPAIVAGVRIATVTVISLATVAAIVGVNEGLGVPILDAIPTTFNTEFIAAAVLTIGLALVADALLVGVQRLLTPWARGRAAYR